MKPRYLVLVAKTKPIPIDWVQFAAEIGLRVVVDAFPTMVCVNSAARTYAVGKGVIVGSLFPRHGPPRELCSLAAGNTEQILKTSGGELLRSFWGSYLSIIPSGPSVTRVLRDPSGTLNCYYIDGSAFTIFASDVDLLFDTGLVSSSVDWSAVGRHHLDGGLPSSLTCLTDVQELLPGCSLDVPGDHQQVPRWSPWNFVNASPDPHGDPVHERLRRVIDNCCQALASRHDQLLLSVSGGLDSSILASCLARGGHEVRCLTMYTDDRAGDERMYARALCRHLGLPLVECRYQLEDVDIDRAVSAHLPRPIGRTLNQAFERRHLEVARNGGIDAFVSGNGGDNVFGYSQSAAAIADRWLSEGMTVGVWRTLWSICQQTGCGPTAAIRGAIRSRFRRTYRWRWQPAFLSQEVAAMGEGGPKHAWLEAPAATLPAKAAHVAALLRVQPLLDPGRTALAPVIYPLVSQPVIEACLAISSWEWRTRGRDRAVARDAFSSDLPDLISRRRIKVGPDGFSGTILNSHREAIRSRLLDGNLARQNLVDRLALETALRGEQPIQAADQTRILDLLDTEAWGEHWQARLAKVSFRPAFGEFLSAPPSV